MHLNAHSYGNISSMAFFDGKDPKIEFLLNNSFRLLGSTLAYLCGFHFIYSFSPVNPSFITKFYFRKLVVGLLPRFKI